MLKYGSDKPDLRFGLEIQDGTEVTRGSEFGVFAGAPVVRFLVVPQELSRGDLAKLETIAKEWGAKGLAYLVSGADGEVRSPIAKFLSQEELDAFAAPPASTVLFAADEQAAVERVLGALRLHLGRELGLVDEERNAFHWILDFPLFQVDDETGRWTFVHHLFTGALDGHEELIETDPANALSQHYDLIWNGWELGSGSIRFIDPKFRSRSWAMGMSKEEARAKFGWFLAAQMGAPASSRSVSTASSRSSPASRTFGRSSRSRRSRSGADPLTGAPSAIPPMCSASSGSVYSKSPHDTPRALTCAGTRFRHEGVAGT